MRHAVPDLLIAAAVVSAPSARAQERHPIAAQVAAAVKDPAKPFTLVIALKVKDGSADKFEAAFGKAQKETRKEKGCLTYDLNRDAKGGGYVIYERWKDLAALEAHLASDHIKALFGDIGPALDGPPETKILVPVGE